MLNVQTYLMGGKTLDDLHTELGIEIAEHPTEPLVILNYNMIESPKLDPIVRECRALVLEKGTWRVIAKSFNRFFNWGEVAEEMDWFDWADFTSTQKEDGSIVLVYWYNGYWHINTRGSFAQGICSIESGKTWDELIRPLLGDVLLNYDMGGDGMYGDYNYVFEFCSLHNKVVTYYKEPKVFLLSVFNVIDGDNPRELSIQGVDDAAENFGWETVAYHSFKQLEEIHKHLERLEKDEPTNEGVVIRDKENRRWKLKNKRYLTLHKMWTNGEFTPKVLLPWVMAGDADELLTYYPEVIDKFNAVAAKVQAAFDELQVIWETHKDIVDQKEFALTIVPLTKFTGMLFNVRKRKGTNQTLDDLKVEWHSKTKTGEYKILDVLF